MIILWSGVPLFTAMLVGTVTALFQTMFQVQEQTTQYLLKLVAVSLSVWLLYKVTGTNIIELTQKTLASNFEIGSWSKQL